MPEYLRALIVILGIALPIFWVARRSLCDGILSEQEYAQNQKAWLVVTLIAFFAHNFWLFFIVTGVYLRAHAKKYDNPIALYFVLLVALPPDGRVIPGIGPIDHILSVDYYKLLSICVLLPFAIHGFKTRHERHNHSRQLSFFAVGLLSWMVIIRAVNEPTIHFLRGTIYALTDVALPYYAATIAFRHVRDFKRLAGTAVVACVILGAMAIFESTRHWLLYSALPQVLGAPEGLTQYLLRSEGGSLRAKVSVGNPIVLGYLLMIALAMLAYLHPLIRPTWVRNIAWASLIGGLIATLSRGPWVGCAAMALTMLALGPGLAKRVSWAIFGGGTVTVFILLSPWADTVISFIPFLGNAEKGTVDYRERLFEVSMLVVQQHPLVGDLYFMKNPLLEQMRQGEGIIDIVNTYLGVLLPFGYIGLALFVALLLSALSAVQRARKLVIIDQDTERFGRALIASLIGIMVTIGTVSSIGIIPMLCSFWIGLCASFSNLVQSNAAAQEHPTKPARKFRPRSA